MLLFYVFRALLLLFFTIIIAGCSHISDAQVEYEKATSLPSLEIPPDLVTPHSDDEMVIPTLSKQYSEYTNDSSEKTHTNSVLPALEQVKVLRDGQQRWIVVNGSAEQIWAKVRNFWITQGFPIKHEDPKAGIMETDWLENRANIPQSGVRALFGKVLDKLYDSSTRDRFRIRLERSDASNQIEIYISHVGIEEVTKGDGTVWQTRPHDYELEAIMLQRLMVSMGLKEDQAKTMLAVTDNRAERAQLAKIDGNNGLIINEDFPRAWRNVGLILDQIGFTVEDRDRSSGTYYVRYNDPLINEKQDKGFFSKLAFWRSKDNELSNEQYQIFLRDRKEHTEIIVRTKDGNHDSSDTARRILTLLQERLR